MKLVFHIGVNAGFFSEYNNMLLAYLYCIEKKIKFVIYSKDANFAFNTGWNDYFEPFTDESKLSFHKKFNYRSKIEFNYFKSKKLIRKINFWKAISGTTYLTYDIFDIIRSPEYLNKQFNLIEYPGKDSLKGIFHELIKKTWKYNRNTELEIENIINQLALPIEYIGIHIRSGDKINEYRAFSCDDYINKAKSLTDIKNLFIATDDYNNILEIKSKFPNYKLFSFCTKDKNGYNQKIFEKQGKSVIKKEMIELFATVEVLSNATYFIGTYSSNIGTFVSSKRNYNNSYAVDFEEWRIW